MTPTTSPAPRPAWSASASPPSVAGTSLETAEPVTGSQVLLDVAPRIQQPRVPHRLQRAWPHRPRRTPGPRVSPGPARSARASSATPCSAAPTTAPLTSFFTDGLGFKVSDRIAGVGAFMRCSTDHHNVLVLAAPVNFLHHTSWQVDDVDEVGRGAIAMLEGHPGAARMGARPALRRVELLLVPQGPGRATSPSTTPTWTASWMTSCGRPEDLEGARGLFSWGPPPPAVVPAPRGPRRHDDRRPRPPLTRRKIC